MNVNDLKTRLEVWKHYKEKNAAGTPETNFVLYKTTYGNLKIDGGSSTWNNPEGELPSTTVTIVVRYDSNIDYDCEIFKRVKKQPERNQIAGNTDKIQKYKIKFIEELPGNFMSLKCITYNEYN